MDDDPRVRFVLEETLRARGHFVMGARDGEEALQRLSGGFYELVLADVRMPKLGGHRLLARIQERHPGTSVVLLTGFGGVESAVAAIKKGAHDYLTKPISSQKLVLAVEKALAARLLESPPSLLQHGVEERLRTVFLMGTSERIHGACRRIDQAACTDTPIVLLGEPGTGKETVAREIHDLSSYRLGPFVTMNFGTLPVPPSAERTGLEAALVSGAAGFSEGLFEAALGGTLFLDQIGTAPISAQLQLLRALQDEDRQRPGSRASKTKRVRIIAASNTDLNEAINTGTFQPDLYYRLSPVVVTLPPLRDRVEDIHLLAEHFLREEGHRLHQPLRSLSPRTLERLVAQRWPGNVRELQAVMKHAAMFPRKKTVRPMDLPQIYQGNDGDLMNLQELERRHIREVLQKTGGNKSQAAKILGIARPTLYRKLQQLGLEKPCPSGE